MSKALVIKGANFAANKIETISLAKAIPCTGITISQDTLALSAIGATATLTATTLPSNTTEAVSWVSSDEDIITVNNGVVTCVGVGTATIMVACGTFSAECVVTCTASIDTTKLWYRDGNEITGIELSANPPKDYIGSYSSKTRRQFGYTENVLNGYRAYSGNDSAHVGVYPIPIPNGASTIHITFPDAFVKCRIVLMDALQYPTYGTVSANSGARALADSLTVDAQNGSFTYIIDKSVGANSFVFHLRTNSADTSTVTGDVNVLFS